MADEKQPTAAQRFKAGELAFSKGDRVAWHHEFATLHAKGSIAREDAVPQLPEKHPRFGEAGTGQLGTITGVGNDEGSWFTVELDSGETWTLTGEELVRVAAE